MAIGDILSATVRPDGWSMDVVIDGFVPGATYDFGSMGNSPATIASPKFSAAIVSQGYSASGVLGTVNRSAYGGKVVRVPYSTATIAGTYVSGTFADGETVTQATSGATAKVVGNQSSGPVLRVLGVTGTPDSTHIWNGASASFTASATPVTLSAPSPDELNSGTSLKVRVNLSDPIYANDKNGGAGTSGTNPAVTIAAGWAINSGGGAQASNAATALAVTNNSTLAYPKVVAQWAWGHTPFFKRVSADFVMGCIAQHGFGLACVALTATDAHSHSVTGIATAKTDHTLPTTNLHYESYDLPVSVATFTPGDDIVLKYVAYPIVGDASAVLDTSADTNAFDAIMGNAQITCTYKTSGVVTKYVAQSGSDAANGDTAGTAYATIGKALEAGADIVKITNGSTLDILGKTPSAVPVKNYWVEVMPDTGATVALTRGSFTAYGTKRLAYVGIQSITYASGNGWLEGGNSDRMLKFENSTVSGSTGLVVGLAYGSYGCWHVGCNLGSDRYGGWASDYYEYSFTGCAIAPTTSAGFTSKAQRTLIGCTLNGGAVADYISLGDKLSGAANPNTTNAMFMNNKFVNCALSANNLFRYGFNFLIDGMAFVGNVLESVSGTLEMVWIGGDSSTPNINNLIFAHNTVAGERCNLFYNDQGTTANVRTNIFFRNNALEGMAIKSDTFGTQNGNRVGNWAMINGVSFSDNRYNGDSRLFSFVQDYLGINCAYVSNASTFAPLGFTNDAGKYGSGSGNGNYLPVGGSVLKAQTLYKKYQSFDLNGVALA